jgi:hypothetical protein
MEASRSDTWFSSVDVDGFAAGTGNIFRHGGKQQLGGKEWSPHRAIRRAIGDYAPLQSSSSLM